MIRFGLHREPGMPDDLRVVRVDLDAAVPLSDPLFSVLSDEERAAAARFHRPADAVRSAATRSVLRRALAAELGAAPEALRFSRTDRGRPALDAAGAGPPPLDFNVAHGGDHALVAWSRVRRVGVDVEPLRAGWDWRPLARTVLGEEDARRIAGAPEAARAALFFDVWTAKEALLKADGRGITAGLDGFSVLGEGHPHVGGVSVLAEELRRFEARWLRGIPGHAACVAWSAAAGPD